MGEFFKAMQAIVLGNKYDAARYREGHIGYWSTASIEGTYNARTLFGFRVNLKFSGVIDRLDPKEFQSAKMLDNNGPQRALDHLYRTVIQSAVSQRMVLVHSWAGGTASRSTEWLRPSLWTFFRHDDGRLRYDPNCCDFINWVNCHNVRYGGCSIRLMLIDTDMDSCLKDNYAMLTPQEIAEALENQTFRRYHESVIVVTLKERNRIRQALAASQTDQRHQGNTYSITTLLDQGNVRISWAFDKALVGALRLIGVSEANQFGADIYSTMARGRRIVDTATDGSIVDHLEPGQSLFYTFAIQGTRNVSINPFNPRLEYQWDDPIRFMIRVPSVRDDEERLKAEVAIKGLRSMLDEPRTETDEVLRKINTFKSMSALLHEQHQKGIAEIESMTIDKDEKAHRREVWEAFCEQLRMTYGG